MRNVLYRVAPFALLFSLAAHAQQPKSAPAPKPTEAPKSAPTSTSAPASIPASQSASMPSSGPSVPPASYPSKPTLNPEQLPIPPDGIVDVYSIFGTGGLRFVPDVSVTAALFDPNSDGQSEPIQKLEQKTDAKGLARFVFSEYAPGLILRAYATYNGTVFEAAPAQLVEKEGTATVLALFDLKTDLKDIGLGEDSFMAVLFDEGVVTFIERLFIENNTDKAYLPPSGTLPIPLPEGAFGAEFVPSFYYEGTSSGENQSELALDLKAKPLLPGPTQVLLRFHMSPPDDTTMDIEIPMLFSTKNFGVQAQNNPPIGDLVVDGFQEAKPVKGKGGQDYLVAKGPAGKTVYIEVSGLPYGNPAKPLLWGIFIVFGITAFLLFALVPKARPEEEKKNEGFKEERERLYRDLIALEQGRIEKKVTPERYQKQREEKLKRLMNLTRLTS